MPDNEDDASADELLGRSNRLLRIAEIVRYDDFHALTEYASCRVDVGHGCLRAALHLLSDPGELTGNRCAYPHEYFGMRGATERGGKDSNGYGKQAAHGYPLPKVGL